MTKKKPARPDRTERRSRDRAARGLVHDIERLARLEPGGSQERPIDVVSSSVIEPRARSMRCPQCQGEYTLDDHQAPAPGLRRVDVTCRICHVRRALWFRLAPVDPN
jgi:hypothetical protein